MRKHSDGVQQRYKLLSPIENDISGGNLHQVLELSALYNPEKIFLLSRVSSARRSYGEQFMA